MDKSQLEVLENGFRCKCPNDLTAFSEEYFDAFPVGEETENYLEVPPLDPLVETCLLNRHGEKASFKRSKGRSFFTQPSKMVEKIAYKGQQSSRLGIVIQLYLQQSLGNLVEFINSSDFDKQKATQHIKDIFAMSTKGLDQISRSGAFHHIVRRTVAMTDTALCDLSDSKDYSNLPLTGEGVFGSGLETLLKSRKEKKKQLDEMLPELKKKDRKRRLSPDRPLDPKRLYNTESLSTHSNSWNNFRIPKVPRDNDRYKSNQSQSSWNKYNRTKSGSDYTSGKRSNTSRGKLGKPASQ